MAPSPRAPSQTVLNGDSITFIIAANPGYQITDVGVDGVSLGALSHYAFTDINADHAITASFGVITYTLTMGKFGSGSGVITSTPAGIDCGGTCQYAFPYNTVVTLTVTPDAGSAFFSWGDACNGSGPCVVSMDAIKNVNVTLLTRRAYLPQLMK